MGNRQSTPSASCDLICGRGAANYNHCITLCTTAPACRGREGERMRGEGENDEKARDKQMENVQGQESQEKGGTDTEM